MRSQYRAANLAELHSWGIQPTDFCSKLHCGDIPPTDFARVTLEDIPLRTGHVSCQRVLNDMVAHDLQGTIAQNLQDIAFQHRREVGPWEAYLSILAPPRPQ